MNWGKLSVRFLLLCVVVGASAARAGETVATGAYPPRERQEYVLACALAKGDTAEMRKRCACSIDAIARILPFERYLRAETVLRMRSLGGPRAALYREAPNLDVLVEEFRAAQAASLKPCFGNE
jgi:hypothetical protein